MAPEQVEGQRGDVRTDLYALGIILFELLAGKPPFTGDSPLAVMAMHIQQPAPRLDQVRPDVPAPLAAIVARCLQRSPDNRYPNMVALIDALDHPEAVDLSALTQVNSNAGGAPAWWKSTPVRAVIISVGIVVLLVVCAVLLQSLKG